MDYHDQRQVTAASLFIAAGIGILAGLLLAYVGFLAATATMPLLEGGWR
jgi:uncharacterized membrane protein YhiD involved in acid resistance